MGTNLKKIKRWDNVWGLQFRNNDNTYIIQSLKSGRFDMLHWCKCVHLRDCEQSLLRMHMLTVIPYVG